ncbi:cyclic nucleotide-binding domain-containing protein [Anderseniella sp. Alg231-50]|uniref:cyclic nucleotide-binding domain-containing protein n=1 Tax=Anderseniella sp. Alg231-50 TaxID=1922226 RepID=UPI000D55F2C6
MTEPENGALIKGRGLKNSRLIGELGSPSLEALGNAATRLILDKGATLFYQQDPGDALYVLESGSVEISILGESGKKLSLNVMRPPDVFGEVAALDGGPRTATATTLEPCVLWKFEQADIDTVIRSHPELASDLIKVLCARLRWVSQQVEDLAMLDIEARLASRLLILHGKFSDSDGCIRLSQSELADFLGATRESINKTLQTWRAQDVIRMSRGAIWIENIDLLNEIATTPQ